MDEHFTNRHLEVTPWFQFQALLFKSLIYKHLLVSLNFDVGMFVISTFINVFLITYVGNNNFIEKWYCRINGIYMNDIQSKTSRYLISFFNIKQVKMGVSNGKRNG